MPVFPDLIFIHIPKTGGTSFLDFLVKAYKKEAIYSEPVFVPNFHSLYPCRHKTYIHYESELGDSISNYNIVSLVRNPFFRIVSYYKMHLFYTKNLSEIEKINNFTSIGENFNFYIKKILLEKDLPLIDKSSMTYKPTLTHLTQTNFLEDRYGTLNKKINILKLEDISCNLKKINSSQLSLEDRECYNYKDNLEIIKEYFYKDFINFNYSFIL